MISTFGMIIFIWVVTVFICIPAMKKIQPETYKAYAVYALTVCVMFTVIVVFCTFH